MAVYRKQSHHDGGQDLSFWLTTQLPILTPLFLVVKAFMMGGCMIGTSAI